MCTENTLCLAVAVFARVLLSFPSLEEVNRSSVILVPPRRPRLSLHHGWLPGSRVLPLSPWILALLGRLHLAALLSWRRPGHVQRDVAAHERRARALRAVERVQLAVQGKGCRLESLLRRRRSEVTSSSVESELICLKVSCAK